MRNTVVYTLDSEVAKPLEKAYLKYVQFAQYAGLSSQILSRYLRTLRLNIIHAHFGYDGILVYENAKQLKLPLIITLHGHDITYSADVWRKESAGLFFRLYPKKLEKLFNDRMVFFIAVSEALRQRAIERGVAPERCVVRYTGTDHTLFSPPINDRRSSTILFVGRLELFKGCDVLIRAMALVARTQADAKLVVVGDGPQRVNLEELARELRVDAVFLGARPRDEVRYWMANARVFCQPSVTVGQSFETFGMVVLEAQFSGLPVVTSARGGAESVLHGKTGFVFPEGNIDRLASYIILLLTHPSLWNNFSKSAYDHVMLHFTLKSCTRKIEEYYDQITTQSTTARK